MRFLKLVKKAKCFNMKCVKYIQIDISFILFLKNRSYINIYIATLIATNTHIFQ